VEKMTSTKSHIKITKMTKIIKKTQKSESSRMAKHHHVPFAKLFYSETSALLQVWSQHLRCAVLQGTAQRGWC